MMGAPDLAGRLRAILNPRGGAPGVPPEGGRAAATGPIDRILSGEWLDGQPGSCVVVSRRIAPLEQYGRATIGQLADLCRECAGEAALIARGATMPPPYVFFDLETTGLSGGAGTYGFLVGCGRFDEDRAFVTRQYFLAGFAAEPALLSAVSAEMARAGALVSFNGKSFDAPLLENRFLFHRLDSAASSLPHLDVLHPARRFWGPALEPEVMTDALLGELEISDRAGSCSLVALERVVLGAGRGTDVPGFEIPARYFRFVRTGDPRPLVAVLEHNRRDLLALAALTARLLHLVRTGVSAAGSSREALALGRLYGRAGLESRAREAYLRALAATDGRTDGRSRAPGRGGSRSNHDPIRIAALRGLALLSRRSGRFEEAAGYWKSLLEDGQCPVRIAREATEALAIHHEHRARDLVRARQFALNSLSLVNPEDADARRGWKEAVQHRLARLEAKLSARALGRGAGGGPSAAVSAPLPGLQPSLPLPPSSGSRTSAPRTSS